MSIIQKESTLYVQTFKLHRRMTPRPEFTAVDAVNSDILKKWNHKSHSVSLCRHAIDTALDGIVVIVTDKCHSFIHQAASSKVHQCDIFGCEGHLISHIPRQSQLTRPSGEAATWGHLMLVSLRLSLPQFLVTQMSCLLPFVAITLKKQVGYHFMKSYRIVKLLKNFKQPLLLNYTEKLNLKPEEVMKRTVRLPCGAAMI